MSQNSEKSMKEDGKGIKKRMNENKNTFIISVSHCRYKKDKKPQNKIHFEL